MKGKLSGCVCDCGAVGGLGGERVRLKWKGLICFVVRRAPPPPVLNERETEREIQRERESTRHACSE